MSPFRALFIAAMAVPGLAFAGGSSLAVHLDETLPVTLSGAAGQIVVANPSVADVTLTDRRHLMILGRTYGETSVVVLDGVGRRIYATTVTVTPAMAGHVSVFRGAEVYNYACNDRCERTPLPGEDTAVYQHAVTAYTEYPNRAKGAAATASGGNP